MYLKELGFDEKLINQMIENIPECSQKKLTDQKETVTTNINYLKELGVENIPEAFVKFYNMFLLSPQEFDEIFSKYDREDLVEKLHKNVAIMEYL